MTKEDILQIIKENLVVELVKNFDGYYGNDFIVTVRLLLNGDIISTDDVTIREAE